jgi:hypothetical protein
MHQPYRQQVFEQPTSLLEDNPSTIIQNHHPFTHQASLDTLIDTMTEASKRKRSLERNRLAGKRWLCSKIKQFVFNQFHYFSIALSRKKEK